VAIQVVSLLTTSPLYHLLREGDRALYGLILLRSDDEQVQVVVLLLPHLLLLRSGGAILYGLIHPPLGGDVVDPIHPGGIARVGVNLPRIPNNITHPPPPPRKGIPKNHLQGIIMIIVDDTPSIVNAVLHPEVPHVVHQDQVRRGERVLPRVSTMEGGYDHVLRIMNDMSIGLIIVVVVEEENKSRPPQIILILHPPW
jgi:hypothetical protein